ncbi:MAG: hypothetical protein U0841_15750 [Chloroflexia bacterium]
MIACCGQLWQSAIVIMSDTTALALATAGVWALLRYSRHRHGGWPALAAGCLAWAILTRWAYALVALPCALYALWLLIRSTPAERRRLLLHALGAAAITITILSPLLLPALETLRQPNPQSAIRNPQFSELSRWNPLYAFRREFTNADGRLTYELPNGLYYATLPARPLYFTPVLAFATLPGLWRIARRPTPPLLLLLGWLAAIIGFHAGSTWQNVRYILACAPPGAILIALGLATLWERRNRRLTIATSALLALGLAWMLASNFPLLGNFIDRKEADLAIAQSITLPADAHLLSFGLTLTLSHYTPYPTHELSELTPATLAALLAETTPPTSSSTYPTSKPSGATAPPKPTTTGSATPPASPPPNTAPTPSSKSARTAVHPQHSSSLLRYSLLVLHSALSTQHSSTAMKIALIVPGFSADEQDWCIPALRNLVGELARADEIVVITLRYPYRAARYTAFGARVIALGGAQARGIASAALWRRTLAAIRAEHRRGRIDALHAFWATEAGALAAVAGRLLRIPTIVSLAGGELANLPDIGYGDQLAPAQRAKVRLALRLATHVTGGSRTLLDLAAPHLRHLPPPASPPSPSASIPPSSPHPPPHSSFVIVIRHFVLHPPLPLLSPLPSRWFTPPPRPRQRPGAAPPRHRPPPRAGPSRHPHHRR